MKGESEGSVNYKYAYEGAVELLDEELGREPTNVEIEEFMNDREIPALEE